METVASGVGIDLPFAVEEYTGRLRRVRAAASAVGIELLVVTDPKNLCYLTGYDSYSHYVPQALLVPVDDVPPVLVLRAQDVPGGRYRTWLPPDAVVGYPEDCVFGLGERSDGKKGGRHPFAVVADVVAERGWGAGRLGAELDGTLTPRELDLLRAGLPRAGLVAGDGIVERVRTVKSPAEVAVMREAAAIGDHAMRVAQEAIVPGAREADVAAAIYAALVRGTGELYGSTPAQPYMAAGTRTNTSHLRWSGRAYERGVPIMVELGGHRHNYAAGLSRTFHLGEPTAAYRHVADTVTEGLHAVLGAITPGTRAEDVDAAWRRVVEPRGITKAARIGYSIGLSFPPAVWIDRTVSLAPGDRTELVENMMLHLMLAVWLDGGGYSFSETVRVGADGPELLSTMPRELVVTP